MKIIVHCKVYGMRIWVSFVTKLNVSVTTIHTNIMYRNLPCRGVPKSNGLMLVHDNKNAPSPYITVFSFQLVVTSLNLNISYTNSMKTILYTSLRAVNLSDNVPFLSKFSKPRTWKHYARGVSIAGFQHLSHLQEANIVLLVWSTIITSQFTRAKSMSQPSIMRLHYVTV